MLVQTKYGKFHCFADDLITDQLVRFSAHTRNELAMVLDHISEGDVIIDIGAHIGTYSIPIAQKVKQKNGKVYSIEANEKAYSLLVKNIEENNLRDFIFPEQGLLAAEEGKNYSGIQRQSNTGGHFYVESIINYGSQESITLSSFIKKNEIDRIDFIKIDVEGMEHLVLSDIKSVLLEKHPILYVEICDEHLRRHGSSTILIMKFLSDLGYRFYRNTYLRNSTEDTFIKEPLHINEYSDFFDVLAIYHQ